MLLLYSVMPVLFKRYVYLSALLDDYVFFLHRSSFTIGDDSLRYCGANSICIGAIHILKCVLY